MAVGPSPRVARDRFTDVWGLDAEVRGPLAATARPTDRLRELMATREGSSAGGLGQEGTTNAISTATLCSEWGADATDLMQVSPMSPSATSSSFLGASSVGAETTLKGLVEAATGVAASRQKIVFGRIGPLDDDAKALCDYDVGHGALLYLSVRPALNSKNKKTLEHLASPRLASSQEPGIILERIGKFVNGKVGSKKGKDLVRLEVLPDWKRPRPTAVEVEWPHEQAYYDYSLMRDNSFFDLTGRVRRRFRDIPRAAKSVDAGRSLAAHALTAR